MKLLEQTTHKKTFRGLWLIPFLGFFIGYFVAGYFLQKADITTPNIIGKSLHESLEILSNERLGVRLLAQREDQGLPEGFVLDQFPRQAQKIRPNQTIFITLSTKQRSVTMPDLYGKTSDQITQIVESKGLEAKIYTMYAPQPTGTCIAQIPLPDETLVSKKVTLYISDGSPTLSIMPSFIGKNISSVEDTLHDYDVRAELFHLSEQPADHVCHNCVIIDQQPSPGSIVDLSGTLHIQFSLQSQ